MYAVAALHQAHPTEADCLSCPDRTRCTSSATRPLSVAVLPWPPHETQTRKRLDQQTEQWQCNYAIRAGIEATLSQNVRTHGLRRSRHRGLVDPQAARKSGQSIPCVTPKESYTLHGNNFRGLIL
ncbi:hypothetical protein GCM10023080_026760 [Streptomyces pseudoechinosporeus]